MTRDDALALLHEYTHSESLRRHALAVEAAMRACARRCGEDEELWGLVGLLHDFDYERWPNPPEHTRQGAALLRARGVEETIVDAILSHAEWNGIHRDTPLKRALFAVDELCGFITAVAWVRPSRTLAEVTPAAVRKKMKDRAFARSVRREDILEGAALLNLELDEHIALCLGAMQAIHVDLGL